MKVPVVQYLHPHGLTKSPGASHVLVKRGTYRTVMVGPQTALDPSGHVVGEGNLTLQAQRVLRNLEIALAAADATFEQVTRWSLSLCSGQSPEPVFAVFQRLWRNRSEPPLLHFVYVAGLAHPDLLLQVEVEAVAAEEA